MCRTVICDRAIAEQPLSGATAPRRRAWAVTASGLEATLTYSQQHTIAVHSLSLRTIRARGFHLLGVANLPTGCCGSRDLPAASAGAVAHLLRLLSQLSCAALPFSIFLSLISYSPSLVLTMKHPCQHTVVVVVLVCCVVFVFVLRLFSSKGTTWWPSYALANQMGEGLVQPHPGHTPPQPLQPPRARTHPGC